MVRNPLCPELETKNYYLTAVWIPKMYFKWVKYIGDVYVTLHRNIRNKDFAQTFWVTIFVR